MRTILCCCNHAILVFPWQEKLVAPLIANTNCTYLDKAIEDKKWIGIEDEKATLQATRVIHASRKESLFFLPKKGA